VYVLVVMYIVIVSCPAVHLRVLGVPYRRCTRWASFQCRAWLSCATSTRVLAASLPTSPALPAGSLPHRSVSRNSLLIHFRLSMYLLFQLNSLLCRKKLKIFSARQHMAYMLSALSPVLPSVHLSATRVDQSKTVEVRIMKFSLYGSPIPLVFAG